MLRKFILLVLLGVLPAAGLLAGEPLPVVVLDPYLDLHTGPGRGYPVTQSVARGAHVEVLFQRTDWVRIRTDKGVDGWVHRTQMQQTLTTEGSPVEARGPAPDARMNHRWEAGIASGGFDGRAVIDLNGAYALTQQLAARVDAAQLLGSNVNGRLLTAGLQYMPWPQWTLAPFAAVGGGARHLQQGVGTDGTVYLGAGVRDYLSDRFLMQAEYRRYEVFADQDEEIDAWLVGFTYYF